MYLFIYFISIGGAPTLQRSNFDYFMHFHKWRADASALQLRCLLTTWVCPKRWGIPFPKSSPPPPSHLGVSLKDGGYLFPKPTYPSPPLTHLGVSLKVGGTLLFSQFEQYALERSDTPTLKLYEFKKHIRMKAPELQRSHAPTPQLY